MIDELLDENYDYVLTKKLQSDPLEKCFSQYRQMSGFLVSLREVVHSERVLTCRSLLKADIEYTTRVFSHQSWTTPECYSMLWESDLHEVSFCADSEKVAHTIASYVAKKLPKRSCCDI